MMSLVGLRFSGCSARAPFSTTPKIPISQEIFSVNPNIQRAALAGRLREAVLRGKATEVVNHVAALAIPDFFPNIPRSMCYETLQELRGFILRSGEEKLIQTVFPKFPEILKGPAAFVQPIREGKLESVRTLLALGFRPSLPEGDVTDSLLLAIAERKFVIARCFLEISQEFNSSQKKFFTGCIGKEPFTGYTTPAYVATVVDAPEFLQYFAEKNGRVDIPNSGQCGEQTPLMAAVRLERKECFDLILRSHYSDIDHVAGDHKRSALMEASVSHPDFVRPLLTAGASHHLIDLSGRSPFFLAVLHDHVEAATCLHEAGADPSFRDREGNTVWHFSLSEQMGQFLQKTLAIAFINSPNILGKTPLSKAIFRKDGKMIQQLLRLGADPGQQIFFEGLPEKMSHINYAKFLAKRQNAEFSWMLDLFTEPRTK